MTIKDGPMKALFFFAVTLTTPKVLLESLVLNCMLKEGLIHSREDIF